MRSVMAHQFSQIPRAEIQRSSFNRSHGYKTTFDSGYLVPFYVDEVLPGDTFNLKCMLFARLATPIVPFMDNMFMETFFFFVPNRLLWDNWQKFNGERENPGDSTDFLIPTIKNTGSFIVGGIADYFGIPTGVNNLEVNALPFRAYKSSFTMSGSEMRIYKIVSLLRKEMAQMMLLIISLLDVVNVMTILLLPFLGHRKVQV